MTAHWSDPLARAGACDEGLEFVRRYATAQAAWDAIPRGDWLGWWMDVFSPPRDRQLAGAAILRYALPIPQEPTSEVALIVVWMAEAIERGDEEEIAAAAGVAAAARVARVAAAARVARVAWAARAAGAARAAWAALGATADAIRIAFPQPPSMGGAK